MEELVDYMIQAKIEHKEYKELSEECESEDLKELYSKLAEHEKESYKMMKEYVLTKVNL